MCHRTLETSQTKELFWIYIYFFLGSGVTVNALHPGVVRTEITRNFRILQMWIFRPLLWFVMYFFFKTPNSGAQTSVYCAVAEELKNVSGEYFKDCTLNKCSALAKDEALAKELWKQSEQLTGINKDWPRVNKANCFGNNIIFTLNFSFFFKTFFSLDHRGLVLDSYFRLNIGFSIAYRFTPKVIPVLYCCSSFSYSFSLVIFIWSLSRWTVSTRILMIYWSTWYNNIIHNNKKIFK